MQKKVGFIALVCFVLIMTGSQLLAALCINCRAQLPGDASFCHKCGEMQPKIQREEQNFLSDEPRRNPVAEVFAYVDEFEAFFEDVKYINVIGRFQEYKNRHSAAVATVQANVHRLSEQQKLLARVYVAKFQILESIAELMRNLRLDPAYKDVLIRAASYSVVYNNEILLELLENHDMTPERISALEEHFINAARRSQNYTVTSKYFQLGKQKLPTREALRVIEIKDKKALVLYLGLAPDGTHIERWVSLRDLERRTTWEKANELFYKPI